MTTTATTTWAASTAPAGQAMSFTGTSTPAQVSRCCPGEGWGEWRDPVPGPAPPPPPQLAPQGHGYSAQVTAGTAGLSPLDTSPGWWPLLGPSVPSHCPPPIRVPHFLTPLLPPASPPLPGLGRVCYAPPGVPGQAGLALSGGSRMEEGGPGPTPHRLILCELSGGGQGLLPAASWAPSRPTPSASQPGSASVSLPRAWVGGQLVPRE